MVELKKSFAKKRTHSNKPKNGHQLQQQVDKYISLAKDAASSGDRVTAERYYQHADHFYRVAMEKRVQQSRNHDPITEVASNPS